MSTDDMMMDIEDSEEGRATQRTLKAAQKVSCPGWRKEFGNVLSEA